MPRQAIARDSQTADQHPPGDRSRASLLWYRLAKAMCGTWLAMFGGWRVSGREQFPTNGGVLLVANHASFLDVFILGISSRRPLNYVARSTLFLPGLGALIRSVGGFPIQREGMGASGIKETLRRLRRGGIVALFPEGTRTPNGELLPLRSGIAVLVERAGVPVVPAGIAGSFEAWPRGQLLPRPRPVWIHYGPPIDPAEIEGLSPEAVTALIQSRIQECLIQARGSRARLMSS